MKRTVDMDERQRCVMGYAVFPKVSQPRKTRAVGTVEQRPDLTPLAENDRERTVEKFRRVQRIVIRAADDHLLSRPPYQVAADDVRMQRPNEESDAPERQGAAPPPR